MSTEYDNVAYPAMLFPVTLPDHLAVVARLHGLDAPPIATARVLEIGGGDGVNLIAMAAAWPEARFVSFDLSSVAVARGKALADAAGLTNIRIEVADILAAATELEGPFDYIIAHGVFAWVPEPVRAAILALTARVLSPEGVAFISYNALPGGHLRRVVRELLQHHLAGIDDFEARLRRAHEVLADFARPRDTDRPTVAALRDVARPMLTRPPALLYHDELAAVWEPQAFSAVVAAANAAGLAFLNDASPPLLYDGLPGNDADGAVPGDEAVVRAAQTSDFGSMTFFHQTLLVHAGRRPARAPVLDALPGMFISSRAKRTGPDSFDFEGNAFEIDDAPLADALAGLAAIWPHRAPLTTIADTPDRCEALFRLFAAQIVELHAAPLPGVAAAGDRPLASPVARAQIALGAPLLYTIDHRIVAMESPGPRAFLQLLDGSRDRAALAADWAASGHGDEVGVDAALQQFASAGFLLR